LVIILRGCCDDSEIGSIRTVDRIKSSPPLECSACGYRPQGSYAVWNKGFYEWGRPLSWLKRIPPLGELEDAREEETISA
jgi:hypothetical protein